MCPTTCFVDSLCAVGERHSRLICGEGGQWYPHSSSSTASSPVTLANVLQCVEPRCDTSLGFHIEGVQCDEAIDWNQTQVYHELHMAYSADQEVIFVSDDDRKTSYKVMPGPEGNLFNRTVNGVIYSFKVIMEGTQPCQIDSRSSAEIRPRAPPKMRSFATVLLPSCHWLQ